MDVDWGGRGEGVRHDRHARQGRRSTCRRTILKSPQSPKKQEGKSFIYSVLS